MLSTRAYLFGLIQNAQEESFLWLPRLKCSWRSRNQTADSWGHAWSWTGHGWPAVQSDRRSHDALMRFHVSNSCTRRGRHVRDTTLWSEWWGGALQLVPVAAVKGTALRRATNQKFEILVWVNHQWRVVFSRSLSPVSLRKCIYHDTHSEDSSLLCQASTQKEKLRILRKRW